MAYIPMQYDAEHNPFGLDITPMKLILLKDATLKEIKAHYKENPKTRQEFDDVRPMGYLTHGTFNTDPLLEHYKIFLKEQGVKYIAIKDR